MKVYIQGSHSFDEVYFKGFSRAFFQGHYQNPRFIFYLKKRKKKNLKKQKFGKKNSEFLYFCFIIFFSKGRWEIKGQTSFVKGLKANQNSS